MKLHLVCSSEWFKLTAFESLERALVASGAKRKLGQAPERRIQEMLELAKDQ